MLTFSDCRRNQSCGFGLYRHPQHPHERSFLCKQSGNDWMILQRNDKLWIRLRRSFLSIQSNELTDLRSIAALAFMAPKTTADLMRIRMYATIKEGSLPFWTAGRASDGSVLAKLRSRYNDLLGRRLVKVWSHWYISNQSASGDLLVNSLGTLAFVNGNTHPIHRLLEFDPLIDWIHEQLNGERVAPTALETYFANRAIYEYRLHKQIPNKNEPQIVNVQCPECKTKSYNVSDTAILFYVLVGIKAEKHQKVKPFQNTSFEGVHLANSVVVSSYAAHFVLTNLKAKMNLCYELGLVEPRNRYQPNKLAPVAITARHSSFDVIGQSLITHLDRSKRANIDESIETVCWQGTCSCAETTCTVRCGQCRNIDKSRLKQELCVRNSFGAAVEVRSVHDEVFHNAQYTVVDILLEHWKNLQNDTLSKPERMEVWLRKCNRRCLRPNRGDNYYFGGDIGGIVVDHSAKFLLLFRMHYVLREDDRWEKATDECGHLFSHLFTITSCV
ncbi:unnamed protein product [Anisakis simplex]|uniref:PLAT domain-containing protein n=1 Tax=Anisakis simplex TaxID=6269 RepID=A0A0M3K3W0_ANISI|nr:unnamed protein product [Anisakis simplex]